MNQHCEVEMLQTMDGRAFGGAELGKSKAQL